MPKTKEQCELMKDERRSQLLHVALESFCAVGFDSTKIDDLAKRAEISHGLLYHYFPTKEDLFFELFFLARKSYRTFEESICNADDSSPIAKVQTLLKALLRKIDEDDDFCQMMYFILNARLIKPNFLESAKAWGVKKKVDHATNRTEVKAPLHEMLSQAVAQGKLTKEGSSQLETVFWVVAHGVVVNKMMHLMHHVPFHTPSAEWFLTAFEPKQ